MRGEAEKMFIGLIKKASDKGGPSVLIIDDFDEFVDMGIYHLIIGGPFMKYLMYEIFSDPSEVLTNKHLFVIGIDGLIQGLRIEFDYYLNN